MRYKGKRNIANRRLKEVDIFCSDLLIVGEVTVTLRNIEEAKNQLEKLNVTAKAAEKFTNKKLYLKVLSVEFTNEEVANFLKKRCKEEGIYLIVRKETIKIRATFVIC